MALAQLLLSLAMAPNPQDTAPTLAASTDGQVKGQGFLGFGSGPSSLNSGSCCGSQVNHEDFKKIKQCGVHWTSRRRPEMFGPTVTAHHYDILDDDAQKVTNGPCIPKDECIKEMAHADVVPCSTATGEFCKKNEYCTGGIHNRCVEIAPGPGECGDDSSQETIVRPSKENLVNSGYPSERAGDCCGRGLVHEEDLYKLAVANSVTDRQVYTLFGTPYVEANKQDYFGPCEEFGQCKARLKKDVPEPCSTKVLPGLYCQAGEICEINFSGNKCVKIMPPGAAALHAVKAGAALANPITAGVAAVDGWFSGKDAANTHHGASV